MSRSKFNIFKENYKHLSSIQIEYIINTLSKHYDFYKGKIRNTGRTALVKSFAIEVGTSISNIYTILSDAKTGLMKSDLTLVNTLSFEAAFARRYPKCKHSNISKLVKAEPFISMVIKDVKAKKLSSIDEVIHDLMLTSPSEIDGLITVCTKTFYKYVHQGKLQLIPLDLPRICSRRNRFKKTYVSKAQKGIGITARPFAPKDRNEFELSFPQVAESLFNIELEKILNLS